ncbi:MAG: hypothetical protein MSH18_09010, partial [Bacteroidales bacterium]|nr:hypothetical protein [Bacteroidales bacterium]
MSFIHSGLYFFAEGELLEQPARVGLCEAKEKQLLCKRFAQEIFDNSLCLYGLTSKVTQNVPNSIVLTRMNFGKLSFSHHKLALRYLAFGKAHAGTTGSAWNFFCMRLPYFVSQM